MKIIITENQYRLLRRQSEIASRIKPTMDLTYEWLQNGQTYPLNRREYDAFISTVAMRLANQIAYESGMYDDERVTLRNQMLHYIKNNHGSEIKDYFFDRVDNFKKINENIVDNNKPVEMLNKLKTDIETLLSYYVKNEDGTFSDKETKSNVDVKPIGGFYKSKIESVVFGAKQEGQPENVLSQLNTIKNQITNGKFKDFFGDYETISIPRQKFDYYTDMKCDNMNPKSPGCKA
jgi:hypothetical protein